MNNSVIEVLKKINFHSRYANICNNYSNYDDGKSFRKNEVDKVLKELEAVLDYSSIDKTYFKDYIFNEISIRFSFTFKYGFIEAFYFISNSVTEDRIRGRFNTIASLVDGNFSAQVNYNFPIVTNVEELTMVISNILELNNDFIKLILPPTGLSLSASET